MANPFNNGTAVGRLVRDLVIKTNSDGSKTVLGTVAVDANYTARDGSRLTDYIPFSRLIPASASGLGGWANVAQGDLIGLAYSIECRPYEKDGETVYPAPRVVVEGFPQYGESRAVTTQRRAEKAKAAASAASPASTAPEAAAAIAAPVAAAAPVQMTPEQEVQHLRNLLANQQQAPAAAPVTGAQSDYSIDNTY